MAWEIERRFLVRISERLRDSIGEGRRLRQGYLRNEGPSVRIRVGEEQGAVLTCKSGSGIRRTTVDTVVPLEMAEALFAAAEDRVLEKIRWRLGRWDLDGFLGSLEGLELLEVELEAEAEALPEPPEGVTILREVTDDSRFVNVRLAQLAPGERRDLVTWAYAGAGE